MSFLYPLRHSRELFVVLLTGFRTLLLEFMRDIIRDQVEKQGHEEKDDARGKQGVVVVAAKAASPISAAMLAGRGRTESTNAPGIAAEPPATMRTTMVSPITRAMPRMTAVVIPRRRRG